MLAWTSLRWPAFAATLALAGSCGGGDSPVNASSGAGTGAGSGTGVVGTTTSDSGADSTSGGAVLTGSGSASGGLECTIETAEADCDDNDPCTHDICDQSGVCFSEAWPDATACEAEDGTAGSCQGGDCVVECTADEDCATDNACTITSCDTRLGACEDSPLDGIDAPVEAQTPGDCSVVTCANGNEVVVADDSDVEDDDNVCTVDVCNRGEPGHDPSTAGLPCGDDGLCNGAGECVECNSPSDCDDLPPDDDCQTRTCTAGVCGQDFAAQGTEVNAVMQTPANCQTIVCDGAGGVESQNDDDDLPVDGLECTADVCNTGAPSNPPAMAGDSCGVDSVCDGFGTCVGCIVADDCDGTSTFCQEITCIGNVCGVSNAPIGLPLPLFDQTDNDCQELACDGAGQTTAIEDAADLPLSDGNDCTAEACTNGLAAFPDLPIDTSCDQDGGTVCDGAGICVECNNATQCTGAGQCEVETCNANACGVGPGGAGQPCDDGAFCTLTDVCDNLGVCGGSGSPCPGPDGDANCSESCNEVTNSCDADDGGMAPCEDGLFCTTGDTCNGSGTCLSGGATCPGPDGDGDCSETCDEGANNCNGPDVPGSLCDDGLFCTATDACNAGVCVGTGETCAGADGDGDCTETCNEFFNNCNSADPNGSACDDGLFCTTTDTCSGGSCVGSGNPCTGADGDGNCAESCSEGNNNCGGNDPVGSACDDGLFCSQTDTCNAAGACVGSGDPCPGPDGDGDCTETCSEGANNCGGDDPDFSICDPGGIFGGACAAGVCVGV